MPCINWSSASARKNSWSAVGANVDVQRSKSRSRDCPSPPRRMPLCRGSCHTEGHEPRGRQRTDQVFRQTIQIELRSLGLGSCRFSLPAPRTEKGSCVFSPPNRGRKRDCFGVTDTPWQRLLANTTPLGQLVFGSRSLLKPSTPVVPSLALTRFQTRCRFSLTTPALHQPLRRPFGITRRTQRLVADRTVRRTITGSEPPAFGYGNVAGYGPLASVGGALDQILVYRLAVSLLAASSRSVTLPRLCFASFAVWTCTS